MLLSICNHHSSCRNVFKKFSQIGWRRNYGCVSCITSSESQHVYQQCYCFLYTR